MATLTVSGLRVATVTDSIVLSLEHRVYLENEHCTQRLSVWMRSDALPDRMPINTGLPVPVFNLIKYFALFVSFDIISRISLNKLKSYSRGCRLAHGYSVPISSNPIDRHGLLSTSLKSVTFLHSVIVFLILGTYSTEILLEFSSDSIVTVRNVPGVMRILPAEEKICGVGGTSDSGVVGHMINFASECIVLDEESKNYVMYNANWEVTSTNVLPKCLKNDANILNQGPVPYSETNWISDRSTGQIDDIPALGQGPHSLQGVFSINVTSEDVYIKPEDRNEDHIGGIYRVLLPRSEITCHGIVCGKRGEKLLRLENRVCTRTSSQTVSNNTDIIFVTGAAVVYSDIAQLDTTQWNASIIANAFFGVQGIRNFSGFVTSRELFSAQAFMFFLGRTHNRDERSLQKYAIVYQNCELVQVPSIHARPRTETVPNATSALIVHAAVKEWALVLVASWSLFLVIIRIILGIAIRRQSLPCCVHGEGNIAKLWFNDNAKGYTSDDEVTEAYCDLESNKRANLGTVLKSGSRQQRKGWDVFSKMARVKLYLSVQEGPETDYITITESPRKVERDTTKLFSSLQ